MLTYFIKLINLYYGSGLDVDPRHYGVVLLKKVSMLMKIYKMNGGHEVVGGVPGNVCFPKWCSGTFTEGLLTGA